MTRKIIVDTDPSPDDAMAFLMALGSPKELELLAVTTVGGNVPLKYTTRNALTLLELCNQASTPVYAGAEAPLVTPLVTAEHVHGSTGLDGYDLPPPTYRAADGFGPDKIVEFVMREPPNSVTLCCIAPLTNVALAMAREPRLASHLQEIVLMGGGRTVIGNISPAAEYNIFADPEAAKKVLGSGVKVTMIPLDVTHKALTCRAWMDRLRAVQKPHMEVFYHLMKANKAFYEEKDGTDGGPLHDPTVTAFLLEPQIFSTRFLNVEIVLEGYARGMTVVDWDGMTDRAPNVHYAYDIDSDRYLTLVIERLELAYRRG